MIAAAALDSGHGKELATQKNMIRRTRVPSLSALFLTAMAISAGADDKTVLPVERKEFHMSMEYPFIFKPTNYLQTVGPAPMRYGNAVIDCSHRNAPPLPAAAKGSPSPTPAAAPEKSPTPPPQTAPAPQAQASPSPSPAADQDVATATAAYPVPDDGPVQKQKGEADFTKVPDEVVGYFRNPYKFVPDSHRFFDPIFDPAHVQSDAQAGPKSAATYTVTP